MQEKIYDSKYKNLELRDIQIEHPLFRGFFENIVDVILSYKKGKVKILELGCGQGALSYCLSLKDVDYVGIDISKEGIDAVRSMVKNERFKFIHGDLDKISINEKFDIVICKDFLHHLKKPANLLKKVKKNIEKDGFFIAFEANTFNPQFLFLNTLALPREIYYYRTTNSYLKKTFRGSGFRIVDNYKFSMFPYDLAISVKYSPFRNADFLKKKEVINKIKKFDDKFSKSFMKIFSSYNVIVSKVSD